MMNDLRDKYIQAIANAMDESTLEEVRLAAVGKKGEVSLKMRELGKMSPEERQVAGPALNALKDEINSALAAKRVALADAALDERLRTEWLDVTLPSRPARQGTIHPISQVTEEVTAIFADMGFGVAEGPRIDSDWYNFDALNIPGHHPARAEMDTFYMHRPRATIAHHMYCAPIPVPCKSGPWKKPVRPCALFVQAVCIVRILTKRIRLCSIRSKVWP
jgi:phenylalanyl-tRNA synthetase alpha chain